MYLIGTFVCRPPLHWGGKPCNGGLHQRLVGGDICLFLIHLLQPLQHGTKCSMMHHKAKQEIFDEISTQFRSVPLRQMSLFCYWITIRLLKF